MPVKKNDIFGFICIVLALAGVGALFLFAPDAKEIEYMPVELTGSSLTVAEPEDHDHLNGLMVTAHLVKPGYINVHQNIGGAPGPVVYSSQYLEAGDYTDYALPVTLEADQLYVVLMFTDDGDHVYEAGVDLPVMSNGAIVRQTLSTPM